MSINATVDGVTYNGVQTISVGGKSIALTETGSGGESGQESRAAYYYTEALNTINRIKTAQNACSGRYLTFGVITDNHVNVGGNYETLSKQSIDSAAWALDEICAFISPDFIANLGDNNWGNNIDNANDLTAAQYVRDSIASVFSKYTSFRLVGNHDQSNNTPTSVYPLSGEFNVFDMYAQTRERGYGYKDFLTAKVRVIILNTCDYYHTTGGYDLSYEQKQFLMSALDLSAKSDAAQWQICILSHIPLDMAGVSSYNTVADVLAILNAYQSGTTVSITVNSAYAAQNNESLSGTLTYNYNGKNSAKIIANFHGHIHNDLYDTMDGADSIYRIAAPNTCFYLASRDKYSQYTNDTEWSHTDSTAQDTSVTFYVVDLESMIVHSIKYGSGRDRTIAYDTSTTAHRVTLNLTGCTASNNATSVEDGESYSCVISPNTGYTLSSVACTMGGVSVPVTGGNTINIASVTGNIVITAAAMEEPFTYQVEDIAVAPRAVFHVPSNETAISSLSMNSDRVSAAVGVSTANDYGFTDGESNAIYLMPVPAKASKVTVTCSDSTLDTARFAAVNISGQTYLKVKEQAFSSNFTFSFTKGSANYICISLRRTDNESMPWGFDDSKVSVTFTNY